jgi:hypothetical protein
VVKFAEINDNKLAALENNIMSKFKKKPLYHWIYINDFSDFCLMEFVVLHSNVAVYKDAKKNLTSFVRFFRIIK